MLRLKRAVAAAAVLAVAACSADSKSPLAPDVPRPTISDAAHAGAVPGFYFLPPMVQQPSYSGTFDAALQPRVEICELSGTTCGATIATFTFGTGSSNVKVDAAGQQYNVNWKTSDYNLDVNKTYRISVYQGTFRLGYADVDVVGAAKDLKNVDTNQYIPLLDDRTLPIKFRIETGIPAQVVVTPASDSVNVGETKQFTASCTDLHGNAVTCPTTTWSSSNTAVATVDATGLATGVDAGTVTITASIGYAQGTATLKVIQPNTPPVANADSFQAIGNVTIPVAAPGVLANDTDTETPSGLSVVAGTVASANGGTVTLAADGSFTYLSAAGFTGTDSFSYTVTDGSLTATGTVTMDVPTRVWYVSNANASAGDGRDASPFSTLAAAEGPSTAGETVFVLYGNGTPAGYDAGFTFKNGQSLTGQGVDSNVTAVVNGQTVVLLAAGGTPTVTNAAAGATLRLAQDNNAQGFNVLSTAGAGVGGSGFGTFTAQDMDVAATGGPSLGLQNGTVAASFASLSSANSAGAGLDLTGVSGSLTAPGGVIAGAAGAGVAISGGNASISYGGSISGSGTRAASITGRTGGTLTLSGDIADTNGGILVQNNTGGTISFNGGSKVLATGASNGVTLANNAGATVSFGGGGLAITTTTGTGFSATGGGTVNVTGAGNTLAASGATALSVVNTTIGSSGMSFRSISAANASSGIVLSNTGAINGVQVTGDGSTAGSGGTIQNTTVSGISATNARNLQFAWMNLVNANTVDGGGAGVCDATTNAGCNGAVKLSGVANVTLSHVAISGGAEEGITGQQVTHLQIANSSIQNVGNAAGEYGIYLVGLFGTASSGNGNSITATTVSGSAAEEIMVRNTSATNAAPGAPDQLLVSGSTFTGSGAIASADVATVSARTTANLQTVVNGSTFTGPGSDCLQVDAQNSAHSDAQVTGTTLQGCNTALNLSGGGTSSSTFDVSSNPTISSVAGAAVSVASLGSAAFRGTVASNPNITSSSASNNGVGFDAVVDATGSVVVDVNGNNIHGLAIGVRGGARNPGTGTADLTVRNNTVAAGGSFAFAGAYFFSGNGSPGESNQVCLNLSNNDVSTSSAFDSAYYLEQYSGNTFQLQGFAGDGTDPAAVSAFVSSRDTGGATVEPFGGAVVNYTAGTCATP